MIALHLSNRHIRIVDGTVSGQRVTVQAMYDEEDTRGCILNGIVMDVDAFSDLMRTIWKNITCLARTCIWLLTAVSLPQRYWNCQSNRKSC